MDRTRRQFLGQLGQASLAGVAFGGVPTAIQSQDGWLYRAHTSDDEVTAYRMQAGRLSAVETIASARPVCLLVHSRIPVLYVLNGIEQYENLPCGTVEVYALHTDGRAALLQRQRLALSATAPRSFVLSPDGRYLVVAVYSGGMYNVVPVDGDGRLGPPCDIRKELGCGQHPERQASAHPHSLVWDGSGQYLFGTDLGSDRINVFRLQGGALERVHEIETQPGAGPAALSFSQAESHLLVRHELHRSAHVYEWEHRSATLTATSSLASMVERPPSAIRLVS